MSNPAEFSLVAAADLPELNNPTFVGGEGESAAQNLLFFTSQKVDSSHLAHKVQNFFIGQKRQTQIETRISAGWLVFLHIPADAPVYFKVDF